LFPGQDTIGYTKAGIGTMSAEKMAYIVQADVPGNNAASVTVAEREEAFAIARNWIKSGHTGVKVIGDGRIYLPAEFDKEDPAGA
jgi:hypothetical protein